MQISKESRSTFAFHQNVLAFRDFIGIDGILIALLLAFLCLRLWGMGIVSRDDSDWILYAYQPSIDPVMDWAKNQGRLWAFPVGSMMLHALFWHGTVYGEVLKFGSFAIFFGSFYIVVAAYWGRRTAGLAACVFVALHALRWEGSALTAYPLLVWVSGISCAIAILAGRHYAISGGPLTLAATGIFLFFAFFNNEGVTVLFAVLFLCSVIANAQIMMPFSLFEGLIARRPRNLLLLGFVVLFIYAVVAVLWLAAHRSQYDGHALAPFDVTNIVTTLMNFSLSGSILYDMLFPYRVAYTDALTLQNIAIVYDLFGYIRPLLANPASLLIGILITWATFATLRRRDEACGKLLRFTVLIVIGIIIACTAVLPVAMTEKYQTWCLKYGINSYTMTVLAHFGVSLVIAGVVLILIPRRLFRLLIILFIATTLGAFGAIGYRMNDAIADDMRPEAGRWRVIALALSTLETTKQPTSSIFAPRLRSGSWFTVVPDNYWTDYVRAKYGAQFNVYTKPSEIADIQSTLSMVDYGLLEDERRFFVTLANVAGEPSDRFIDSISVMLEHPDPSSLVSYVLSFRDRSGALVQKKLVDLPLSADDARIRIISNLRAQVDSVRLTKGSVLADAREPKTTN